MTLFDELKRRNVFRVSAAYLLVAWLILQVVDVVAPMLPNCSLDRPSTSVVLADLFEQVLEFW